MNPAGIRRRTILLETLENSIITNILLFKIIEKALTSTFFIDVQGQISKFTSLNAFPPFFPGSNLLR